MATAQRGDDTAREGGQAAAPQWGSGGAARVERIGEHVVVDAGEGGDGGSM